MGNLQKLTKSFAKFLRAHFLKNSFGRLLLPTGFHAYVLRVWLNFDDKNV